MKLYKFGLCPLFPFFVLLNKSCMLGLFRIFCHRILLWQGSDSVEPKSTKVRVSPFHSFALDSIKIEYLRWLSLFRRFSYSSLIYPPTISSTISSILLPIHLRPSNLLSSYLVSHPSIQDGQKTGMDAVPAIYGSRTRREHPDRSYHSRSFSPEPSAYYPQQFGTGCILSSDRSKTWS